MEYAISIAIGIGAGILSGLFGVGGGILIVPLLIIAFGFSQQKANGTSLVALLAPVGLLAVKNYYDAKMIDLPKGATVAVGIFAGAYVGSKIAVSLDPVIARKSFAVFIACVSIYLYFKK